MAHRGRLYPLSSHRVINADAPYPYWAARRYHISTPAASGGLLAAYFPTSCDVEEKDVFPHEQVQFTGVHVVDPFINIQFDMRIGWDNTNVAKRYYVVGMKFVSIPFTSTLGFWFGRALNDSRIDIAQVGPFNTNSVINITFALDCLVEAIGY